MAKNKDLTKGDIASFQKMIENANKNKIDKTDEDFKDTPVIGEGAMAKIIAQENKARMLAGEKPIEEVKVKQEDEVIISDEEYLRKQEEDKAQLDGMIITEDDDLDEDPDQLGYSITKAEFEAGNRPKTGPMSDVARSQEKLMNNTDKYMKDMDEEIKKHRAIEEELKGEVIPEDELIDEIYLHDASDNVDVEDNEERDKNIEEARVIIDKTNVGRVIEFTDEERQKLQEVKTIKLEQIVVKELKTLPIKKKKKKDVKKLLASVLEPHRVTIPLIVSGFSITLKGASIFDIMTLVGAYDEQGKQSENQRLKWSLIHKHIVSTSIGELSYSDFMDKVSSHDYDICVYGLACATFPDKSELIISCDNLDCGVKFRYPYSMQELLRVELMNSIQKEHLQEVIRIKDEFDTATNYKYNKSLMCEDVRLELPMSNIIVDFEYKSAHTAITNIVDKMQKKELSKRYQYSVLFLLFIKQILIYDEEEGAYLKYDDMEDILEILSSIPSLDYSLLEKQLVKMGENTNIRFGINDLACPNCGKKHNTFFVDLERLVFQECQRERNLVVE